MIQFSTAMVLGLCFATSACKSEKTCDPTPLVSPWTELGVAEGQVCTATPNGLRFITNQKDAIAYAEVVGKKLAAKGWASVDSTMRPSVIGKDAIVSITGWQHKKDGKTILVDVSSYPASVWKNDPVEVDIRFQ